MRNRLLLPNLLLLAFCCSIVPSSPLAAEDPHAGLYELRTYTTHPGKLDALHARFRDHTIKLFDKHGMTNVAYWTPESQPDTLIYLLAHKDQESRDASFKAFVNDPEWKAAFQKSREDGPLVKKVDSVMLKATDYSPKKSPRELMKDHPGLVYELRTYTTNPGKLENLNARFRDHTMQLFKKHGISNVLYTVPASGERKNDTLIYLIAHRSKDDAAKSWKAFAGDPDWKQAAAESRKDGRIVARQGVKSVYMKPTDYSPMK